MHYKAPVISKKYCLLFSLHNHYSPCESSSSDKSSISNNVGLSSETTIDWLIGVRFDIEFISMLPIGNVAPASFYKTALKIGHNSAQKGKLIFWISFKASI